MLKVALRNVRAHLVRLGLSILAVVLGVSFVAGTFALREMLSTTFDNIVEAGYVGDVYLRGAEDSSAMVQTGASAGAVRNTIPADLAEVAQGVDGVELALADFTGPITLVGADGTAVAGGGAPSFAVAYSDLDPTAAISQGTPPTDASQFALELRSAEAAGLTIGDTTTLVVGGQLHEATLTGLVDMGASMAGATIVFLDQATAAATYAPDGLVATISVFGDGQVDDQVLTDRVRSAVASAGSGNTVEAISGTDMREEARSDIETMLGFVETFLLIFAGISLFVGAFIISNTFAMTVRQRQREFALLRAVGASPLQVFSSILVQAAVVGALGGALGIAGGLGLVTAIKAMFAGMGMELAGDIPLTTSMVVISLVLGIVVSIVSAAVPARRAALVPPVEAMREDSPAPAGSLRLRGIIGLVALGAGAGAVVAAVVQAASDDAASTGGLLGLGAVGVVIGALVLAPVLARPVLTVLAAPFAAWAKPLGKLAQGNVTRNPRRTASTASALMIGMCLVGAASVLAASTQSSMRSVVENESLADLVIQSASGMVPAGAVSDISALPEVGVADAVALDSFYVTEPSSTDDPEMLYALGSTPSTFGRTWQTTTVDGDLASLADGSIAVQERTATAQGWEIGDILTVSSQKGAVTAPVGAIFSSAALDTPLVMDDVSFDSLSATPADQVTILLVKGADGVSAEELKAAVTGAAAPYVIVSVQDNDEFVSSLADQVNQMLTILYALLGLSIVIAILGIVNTLALSVIERTREIGLMRAVGLGRAQLATTIAIESVLTAVFGTVLGLAVGVALAAGLPTVFGSSGLTDLVIPWGSLVTMLVIAVVVGVLAAAWPAIRAARLPVLEAVTVD